MDAGKAQPTRRRPTGRRRAGRALYVETMIHAPMERVWQLTQDPYAHTRWDARFTTITPAPPAADGVQRFEYALRVPFHTVRGTGTTLTTRHGAHGERTSALLFDTRDRLSPLGRGRGYWRYVPVAGGVRFITGYDYRPGWGALGRVLDPILTRRWVWWLTAMSFDRLRIWAEDGIEPERLAWWTAWVPGRSPAPRARRCRSRPPASSGRTPVLQPPASLVRLESAERER